MKNKYIKILISFLLVSVMFVCMYVIFSFDNHTDISTEETKENSENTDIFEFDTTPGFYSETISVKIIAPEGKDVFYTINKQKPEDCDKESDFSEYSESGIRIPSTKNIFVKTVTAQYKDENGWSDEITGTFVVGKQVNERFTTLSVFITTDPENLWGYESGLLVTGKLRDDWIKENPTEKVIPITPAGYMQRGKNSEKLVNIVFFDTDGNTLINQNVGIRVSGAYTRAYPLKSLKVFARKEYDEINYRFNYPLYGQTYSLNNGGKIIDSYKKLLLRSAGSDLGKGQIRDELHQVLAGKAGFFGAQSITPVSVFLNGTYYGQMWAHDVICDEFFEDNLGEYSGKFEVVSGPERSKPDKRYEIDNIEEVQYAYDDWNEMYEKYSKSDLRDDEIFNEFCSEVDVDNYLFYYALNIYINNNDWPYNNHKAYRYYAAEGEEYIPNTYFDGKWRFLPHDMDGYWEPDIDILNNYVNNSKQDRFSPLFHKLIKRQDCVEKFVRYIYELRNGAFSPKEYKNTLREMNDSRYSELKHYFEESSYVKGTLSTVDEYIEKFNYYANARPRTLISDLKEAFGISGDLFDINISSPENCYIKAGENWEITDDFSGEYPIEYPAKFTVYPNVGYELDYWVINGETVYGENEIYIDSSMCINGKVNVVAKVKEIQDKKLIITEYHNEKAGDYLIISNPYSIDISTNGYSLSDDEEKPLKYIMPSTTIKSGETLTVYCENYNGKEKLHNMCVPFNIKKEETVYLTYKHDIVQRVYIEDYPTGSYGKLDMSTGEFKEMR